MSNIYNALLIDSDMTSRGNLKQAAIAAHKIQKVHNSSDLNEGFNVLRNGEKCDVIFISCHFEENDISSFIKSAKQTPVGADCAYVLVLKASMQGGDKVAQSVLIGADSVLFEPYSVDRLLEITELAAKIKQKNSTSRRKAAIHLLIANIVKEFDKISGYMARGLNVEHAMKKFRERCDSLKKFQNESFDVYCETAIDLMESLPPPVVNTPAYEGASKRLKAKMEAKLAEQYQKEFGEEMSEGKGYLD